jgi:hypothetical protein
MTRPRRLICAVCGAGCLGRQWYNRDKGFGLCVACACHLANETRETAESIRDMFGVRGVHYAIPVRDGGDDNG